MSFNLLSHVYCYSNYLEDQFILRRQTLSLYRDLLRATYGLKGEQQKEMKVWIRGEFDRWKETTNEV